MKLSDFLFSIGRPVAFYPGLVKALGSMKQAVFICQMAYWKDKGSDPDGWIYKSAEEIETETSLTYKEQIRVRAALVGRKALEEKYARTEHQMYFRVNWDVINSIWEGHLTNGHMPISKVVLDQKSEGTLPKGISLKGTTENTHKNTSDRVDLSEKEFSQAGAKVTAIIDSARKTAYQNRDKIPAPYLEYCDFYVQISGQEPRKAIIQDWLQTFSEWQAAGVSTKHLRAAWEQASRPGGFVVTRPGSLTNFAIAFKGKDKVKVEAGTPIFRAEDHPEPKYAPMPEYIRERFKTVVKSKEVAGDA